MIVGVAFREVVSRAMGERERKWERRRRARESATERKRKRKRGDMVGVDVGGKREKGQVKRNQDVDFFPTEVELTSIPVGVGVGQLTISLLPSSVEDHHPP